MSDEELGKVAGGTTPLIIVSISVISISSVAITVASKKTDENNDPMNENGHGLPF